MTADIPRGTPPPAADYVATLESQLTSLRSDLVAADKKIIELGRELTEREARGFERGVAAAAEAIQAVKAQRNEAHGLYRALDAVRGLAGTGGAT